MSKPDCQKRWLFATLTAASLLAAGYSMTLAQQTKASPIRGKRLKRSRVTCGAKCQHEMPGTLCDLKASQLKTKTRPSMLNPDNELYRGIVSGWLAEHGVVDQSPNINPPLSPAGWQRAGGLVLALADANVAAIFVTDKLRTQQTAMPLSAHTGIDAKIFHQIPKIPTKKFLQEYCAHPTVP